MTDLTPRTRTDPEAAAAAAHRRRWLPIIVIGLVLVAGGVIVTQFLRSAVDYYCNVDEVGVREGCDADRRLRIQGIVQRGIVEENGDTLFDIAFGGATLPVRYAGEPGGIFQECIPVVVHGMLDADTGVFQGDQVEVKHSDEYVSVNDARLEESDVLTDACESVGDG